MSFFGKWSFFLLAVAFFAAGGCTPGDTGSTDEEKEPHYVLGKSRVNAFNYTGAIEAFEESLEANPHSAPAHFQLAILYDNEDSTADPAAAIYHYKECLKYNPKIPNAAVISGRIEACKQKLAENVMQLPSTPVAQQQLEKLMDENRQLRTQLGQWQAAYFALKTNPPVAPAIPAPQTNLSPRPQTSQTPDDLTAGAMATPTVTANRAPAAAAQRNPAPAHTHKVARGETLAGIARSQGISLTALQAANPGVNPKKLKAGQTINLPSP